MTINKHIHDISICMQCNLRSLSVCLAIISFAAGLTLQAWNETSSFSQSQSLFKFWMNQFISFLSSYINSCCFFSVFLFLFPSNRIEGLIHNSKTPCFCFSFSHQQNLWCSVPYLHSTIDWPKFANFQFLESYEMSLICMDGLMFHHHNS